MSVKSKNAPKAKAVDVVPAKKVGIKPNQIKILEVLGKSNAPMTRNAISDKTGIDPSTFTEYVGSTDDGKRLANDVKHFPSLLSMKLVKQQMAEGERGVVYVITAAGKAKLTK